MLTPTEAEERRSSARPPLWSSHLAGAPHRCGRVTLQGKVIWARAREKGYHLKFYLHFISLLTPHYWCRVAALLSQNLSRPPLWSKSPVRCSHRAGRVTWQGLMRGTPLDHRCGRVAKLALERRRVQWHWSRAPTPEPGKGRRPENQHSSKAKRVSALVSCFFLPCPGLPLPGLSWFQVAVSPALSLRVPLCFLFRLVFLSTGRGRHAPAPGGRDVGSNARAPTQEPVQGADPRTGFFMYHLCTNFLRTSLCLTCSFPCTLLFIFRVCFGHCSSYLRHRRFHTQWYKTSPQVLSGFCRSPGEAQAALDGGRRSRWSLPSLFKGTEQRVFRWLSLSKHL